MHPCSPTRRKYPSAAPPPFAQRWIFPSRNRRRHRRSTTASRGLWRWMFTSPRANEKRAVGHDRVTHASKLAAQLAAVNGVARPRTPPAAPLTFPDAIPRARCTHAAAAHRHGSRSERTGARSPRAHAAGRGDDRCPRPPGGLGLLREPAGYRARPGARRHDRRLAARCSAGSRGARRRRRHAPGHTAHVRCRAP